MNKFWYKAAVVAMALGSLTACSDDDPTPDAEKVEVTVGAYVLNTGGWGKNNASIQYIDLENGTISSDLYAAANGEGIGDLAEDLCLYGSKLYATVSGSAKVVVMDKSCKVLKTISLANDEGQAIKPRYMTAVDGNVYFTTYEGYVNKLDTVSMSIVAKVEVGEYPEGITNANGKLYVNNSGYGKGNTVSVIDIASFTKTKDITVKLNPYTQCLTASDGNVYVVSNGNYAGKTGLDEADYVYGTLQRINPSTDTVEDVCNATYIANKGSNMYIVYSEYYLPDRNRSYTYNLSTGAESNFIDLADVENFYGMVADPQSSDIYVLNAPYTSTGDVYIYDETFTKVKSYEAGYYPSKVVFVTE
jgi:YVTN family beta-propeller protein